MTDSSTYGRPSFSICLQVARDTTSRGSSFIDKAFAVLVVQICTLTAHRLRNQEASSRLGGIQRGRMNLNIIDMLHFNVMAHSDRQSIAGNMTIVCRELEQTADTAGCQNNRLCADFFQCTVCVSDNAALADICLLITDDIYQRGIFTDGNVFALSCASQQLAGDFLSGQILVEQNAVLGMCALTGEFEISVLIALKVHAVINQFLRNMREERIIMSTDSLLFS